MSSGSGRTRTLRNRAWEPSLLHCSANVLWSRKPLLFEDSDHGAEESTDAAGEQIGRNVRNLVRLHKQAPGPGCGGDGTEQQNAGLVDGAAERHGAGVCELSRPRAGKVAEGVFAQRRVGGLDQCHGGLSPIANTVWLEYYRRIG